MSVESFAALKDIPVFRAGTHNGLTFSDAEIDQAVRDTAECLPFLREAIASGEYRGNDALNAEHAARGLKIPAFINLAHNRFLPDTLKAILTDSTFDLRRVGEWIVASFGNLKADIAEFIRDRFPFRSVELIKNLYNPQTNKTYPLVFRSVAFLPADIPPAVSGQTPELTIEFAQSSILTVVSHFEEATKMKDEVTGAEMDAQKEADRIAEFAAMQTRLAEFEARLSRAESEKAVVEQRLNAAETKNKTAEVEMFIQRLSHEHGASPAFISKLKPLLCREEKGVLMFGATEEMLKGFAEWIVSNTESIAVAIGEMAKSEAKEPTPKNPQEMRQFALEQAAKKHGLDLAKDYSQVWRFAATENPNIF